MRISCASFARFAAERDRRDAIQAWLGKYGMRGVGEIDVTRPRWSERPSALLPLILTFRNFEPGESERRFKQGLEAARTKEKELLQRVRLLPDGDEKAQEVKRMIDRVRTFVGYREYPKYFLVNRYFAYKQGLMKEADRLVESNVLRDREDAFFLTFHELRDVVRTNVVDYDLIRERKDAFRAHQGLTPPRVLTLDGEMVTGAYRRDNVPPERWSGCRFPLGRSRGARESCSIRRRPTSNPATSSIPHGPQLDAALRGDQRSRNGGRWPDDARRGRRARVRATGYRRCRAGHAIDRRRANDPRAWNRGVRRDACLIAG